jgi:Gpi18-like mannosyltransferase
VLVLGLAAAVAVRLLLLPAQGLRPDLDIFAVWIHWIATDPLGEAYRSSLNFGPPVAYLYWLLAQVQPAFASATDASDLAIRTALKLPAVVADFGLMAGVAWLLRARPRWAIVAALGMGLSPLVVYDSAWWGQSESLYVLAGLVAAILALGGRPHPAAIALALAPMTKPQALVFVPPFAAWAWSRLERRQMAVAAVVLGGTIAVLWLPFLADGRPQAFLATVSRAQDGVFAVLSVRAWNPWWILQSVAGGGRYLSDLGALAGPLTARWIGYLLFLILGVIVIRAVARDPSRRGLLLGLAASVLVGFVALTTMHERYAYAAVVFLAPLLPDRRVLAIWLVLQATVMLNLVAAAPATSELARAVPIDGPLGIVCALVTTAAAIGTLWLLVVSRREADRSG